MHPLSGLFAASSAKNAAQQKRKKRQFPLFGKIRPIPCNLAVKPPFKGYKGLADAGS